MSSPAIDMYNWRMNKKNALVNKVKSVREPLDKEAFVQSIIASGASLTSFVLISEQGK